MSTIESPLKTSNFISGVQGFYNNAESSDVTIKCGENEYKAHQCILKCHGGYFRNVIRDGTTEHESKIIDLSESNPQMVHVLVGFLYGFNYTVPDGEPSATFHARVYSAGDYFQLPHLKQSARNLFRDAEYTLLTGLERAKFCLEAVPEIYSGTPDSDKGLRNVVVKTIKRNIYALLLADNKHAELIESIPTFALDLLQSQIGAPQTSVGWDIQNSLKCPSCSLRFGLVGEVGGEKRYSCPSCRNACSSMTLINTFKNAHGGENMTTC